MREAIPRKSQEGRICRADIRSPVEETHKRVSIVAQGNITSLLPALLELKQCKASTASCRLFS